MLRSHTPLGLIPCTLLLLLVSTSAENRLGTAPEGTPDNHRILFLEAVKKGILSSLNMDGEPGPTQRASQKRLDQMYQLYREQTSAMGQNSSQPPQETQQSMATVLFPSTVLPLKVRGKSGDRDVRWYRAVFHRETKTQTGPTPAQAQLKISSSVLDQLGSVKSEASPKIQIKINGMKPTISTGWTYADSAHPNISRRSQDVILDISPEVNRWVRADNQSLFVDVGFVLNRKSALKVNLSNSLEVAVVQSYPARTRLRRSNKEDGCDDQGWCCRKSVTVSFKEIGWDDWVLAPSEYTMHFCDGTCPHNYKPASMHTQIKSRLHQMTKGGTPDPCCVPAAYESMVLLHYDSRGALKLTAFNDLIVTKCHCA
ncbi:inhibin beta C chain [Cololabis saira]|uniref:inhibin beta C chain n=1 Tax=Cololabis saira TaxID=129043 RepID=UPI002AD29030|nr:inhibin beta C chain [Cololabis saira]